MRIPQQILQAATGILNPFYPELTPAALARALKSALAARLEPMHTVQQTSKWLHVSDWTTRRMLKAGKLRGIRLNNGQWRIDPESVRELLETSATEGSYQNG